MAKRVLVVDDELHIRQILRLHLAAAGYEVDEAADGAGALAAIRAMAPDLVILDLGLPDLPGTEVLHTLRATPGGTAIPVIILTAIGEDGECCQGSAAFVTKPFSARDLLAMVHAQLASA